MFFTVVRRLDMFRRLLFTDDSVREIVWAVCCRRESDVIFMFFTLNSVLMPKTICTEVSIISTSEIGGRKCKTLREGSPVIVHTVFESAQASG